MSEKLIDIIIPAWKSQATIRKTLGSIAMQSASDVVKVTIINDADGIGYSNLILAYNDLLDIQEITLEINSGPGVARQYGIDNTTCPYIMFVDSDDTLYNAFSIEMLLNTILLSETCCMATGKHYLAARNPDLNFIPFSWNFVWIFGKLYRRSFLDKYNIRFPDSRANEDVGFNRSIELIAIASEEEQPLQLDEIVYCWQENPNSITRVDGDFCYNKNIVGYVDNIIYAIKKARSAGVQNKHYVLTRSIQTMANLYLFSEEAYCNKPQYEESNFEACVKYYCEIFEMIELTQDSDFINKIILEQMKLQAKPLADFLPQMTYYQFIKKVREEANEQD